MKRTTLTYDKDPVEIICGDEKCEDCDKLSDSLECGLFFGKTNFVRGDEGTAYRLSICQAYEQKCA